MFMSYARQTYARLSPLVLRQARLLRVDDLVQPQKSGHVQERSRSRTAAVDDHLSRIMKRHAASHDCLQPLYSVRNDDRSWFGVARTASDVLVCAVLWSLGASAARRRSLFTLGPAAVLNLACCRVVGGRNACVGGLRGRENTWGRERAVSSCEQMRSSRGYWFAGLTAVMLGLRWDADGGASVQYRLWTTIRGEVSFGRRVCVQRKAREHGRL